MVNVNPRFVSKKTITRMEWYCAILLLLSILFFMNSCAEVEPQIEAGNCLGLSCDV